MSVARPLGEVAAAEEMLLPALALDLPNTLVHVNPAAAAPAELRALISANAARAFAQPPVTLLRYPPGTLVDGGIAEPFAVLAGDALVREQLPGWERSAEIAARLRAAAAGAPVVPTPCLLVARFGHGVWGHWLLEMLPKILLAERARPGLFTYILPAALPRDAAAVYRAARESLAALGIAPHRWLALPAGRVVRFDALFDIGGVGATPGTRFAPHPGVLAALAALPAAATPDGPRRRVFLLRGEPGTRALVNEEELAATAARQGFVPVAPAELPFPAQLGLFRDAEEVAGSLGSGFCNLALATGRRRVTVLAPLGWRDFYFPPLFQRLDIVHADVRGASRGADPGLAPFEVAREDLALALFAARGGRVSAAVLPGGVEQPRQLGPELFSLTFGAGGDAAAWAGANWAAPEDGHTWSLNLACTLRIPDGLGAGQRRLWVVVEGFPFLPDGVTPVPLGLQVGGKPTGLQPVHGECRVAWPVPGAWFTPDARLRFRTPAATSPLAAGQSDDSRVLGFGFRTLSIHAEPA